MKTLSGQEAKLDFQKRIPLLRNEHLYWCAVAVRWQGKSSAPWIAVDDNAVIFASQLEKALADEKTKAALLLLPTGDILLLGEHLSNAAYRRAAATLEAFIREVGAEPQDATVQDFDLSAAWEPFMVLCKDIYTELQKQAAVKDAPEKPKLMEKLNAELQACQKIFAARAPKSRRLNLLFVEDEPSIRQLLNTLLAHTGHSLSFAGNGREAVAEYCRTSPHIVFLDINLPDVSGLELLELFQKHDPSLHAVMLTSHAAAGEVQTAKQHGAKGYIVKPFSQQKLNECLKAFAG